jgi:hypothetical protein
MAIPMLGDPTGDVKESTPSTRKSTEPVGCGAGQPVQYGRTVARIVTYWPYALIEGATFTLV